MFLHTTILISRSGRGFVEDSMVNRGADIKYAEEN